MGKDRTGKALRVSDYPEDVQTLLRARAKKERMPLYIVISSFNREMLGVMSQEVKFDQEKNQKKFLLRLAPPIFDQLENK